MGQSDSLKCCEHLSPRQGLPEAATLPVTVFHMHQVQVIPPEQASTEEGNAAEDEKPSALLVISTSFPLPFLLEIMK